MHNKSSIPFLKWAGGKRWLASSKQDLFPKSYNHYIEPFLGSGAIFFYLNPHKSILSDINSDLIETYKAISLRWKTVFNHLTTHDKNHSKKYYYNRHRERCLYFQNRLLKPEFRMLLLQELKAANQLTPL